MRAFATAACLCLCLSGVAGAQVIDPSRAEHFDLEPGVEGWHYLKRDEMSVMRMRIAPGASEVLHLHRKARLFVTVLSGAATLILDGKSHVLAVGQGIEVPPDTPHRTMNSATEPVEVLVVAMPPTVGDKVPVGQD